MYQKNILKIIMKKLVFMKSLYNFTPPISQVKMKNYFAYRNSFYSSHLFIGKIFKQYPINQNVEVL